MFWQPVLDWYKQQSTRDQQVLKIGSIVILSGLLYFVVINPLINGHRKVETRIKAAEKELRWMIESAAKFKNSSVTTIRSNRPVSQIATLSAKKFGIVLTRVQPKRNNQLGLWLDTVNFNNLIHWLKAMQGKGLRVDSIDINKTENPGLVKVTLTVSGGVK